MNKFEEWGQKARLVPGFIRIPSILLPFALTAYFVVTKSGIHYWLAEQQAALFDGEYYVVLTGLITLLILLLPVVIIVRMLVPYYEKKKGPYVPKEKPKKEVKDEVI